MTPPTAIPRWTPDVVDVIEQATQHMRQVPYLRLAPAVGAVNPAEVALNCEVARMLLNGAATLVNVADAERRQELAKAFLLTAQTVTSDDAHDVDPFEGEL